MVMFFLTGLVDKLVKPSQLNLWQRNSPPVIQSPRQQYVLLLQSSSSQVSFGGHPNSRFDHSINNNEGIIHWVCICDCCGPYFTILIQKWGRKKKLNYLENILEVIFFLNVCFKF